MAMALYNIRLILYRLVFRRLHVNSEERMHALATEIHHRPGAGVTADLFYRVLNPLGFRVRLHPHNQTVGAEAPQGVQGDPPHWRYRLG